MRQRSDQDALGRVLEAAEAASPVESVEAVTGELAQALHATAVSFLIADLSGRALVRLAHVPAAVVEPHATRPQRVHGQRQSAEESATTLRFDSGPEDRAIRTQRVQVLPPAEGSTGLQQHNWRVLAPVTERGEAIGLLELFLPTEPESSVVSEIARLAHVLAFVLIANRRHTDLYEWGQRTRPLTLSAEIQHRLLAGPQTCEGGCFTLAGWLEPAAAIAGDTFDFSLARNLLHLSITDAMGHGVNAALNATLCVGSLRNTRNQEVSLLDQVVSANRALVEHSAGGTHEDFVTGVIGRLELRTAALELVNAGHAEPFLARGTDVVGIDLPVDLPLGLFANVTYRSSTVVLEPGDRVVLVTDGMLERQAEGLDLREEIAATRHLHSRETVRALADRVLEAAGGTLRDDATVLCIDWHGGHGRDRNSLFGADDVCPGGMRP